MLPLLDLPLWLTPLPRCLPVVLCLCGELEWFFFELAKTVEAPPVSKDNVRRPERMVFMTYQWVRKR